MCVVNFDISNQYRQLNNDQLVDILKKYSSKAKSVEDNVSEDSVVYGEISLFQEMINKLTPSKRELVLSAIELYKRSETKRNSTDRIRNSEDIFRTLYPMIADIQVEELWVLYLNQSAKIIKMERISQGGLTNTVVDLNIIFKHAILCDAKSIILSHNHPSGNIHPSMDDDHITRTIAEAGKSLKIRLLDHVIIAGKDYYSYADDARL